MNDVYYMRNWPPDGWADQCDFAYTRHCDVERHQDGILLKGEWVTWLDTEGGLVCTCNHRSEVTPCSHGKELLGLQEILRKGIYGGTAKADRNRNGLYLEFDTWTNDLIESLDKVEEGLQAGLFFDGLYIFKLQVTSDQDIFPWGIANESGARTTKALASYGNRTSRRIWLPESAMADILDLSSSGQICAGERIDRILSFANRKTTEKFKHPNIQGRLDPAQVEGVQWMADAFEHGLGVVLADQMGVGKTLQIIAHIQGLKDSEKLKRALVAVPAGAIDHWMNELKRFAPELECIAWEGTARKKLEPILHDVDVVITTHKLMSWDSHILRKLNWTIYAIDEAQDAKNPESELAIESVLLPAFQKIPITGTPVENSLIDLHTIFTIALPGLLGRQAHFRRDFADPVKKERADSEDLLEKLHAVVSPFMKARTQQSAGLSIPKPNIKNPLIELKGDIDAYRVVSEEAKDAIKTEDFSIFHQITMLRQAAADYRLITGDYNGEESTKTKWIAEYAMERLKRGRQILLFSTWTSQLDLLRRALENRGFPVDSIGRIDGSLNRKQKRMAESSFKEGHTRILEITLKAGGRSLNLPEADDVIIAIPWWNPAVMMQAAYRAVRRGQTKTIEVSIPIIKDSIEERLMEIQQRKAQISSTILQPASGSGGLTRKQLVELINAS